MDSLDINKDKGNYVEWFLLLFSSIATSKK